MHWATANQWAQALAQSMSISFPGQGFRPTIHIVGSIRREKPKGISDIDLLVVVPSHFESKLDASEIKLRNGFEILKNIGGGRRRTMWVRRPSMKGGIIQLDVFVALRLEEPFALFHHTGSADYNIRIRKFANSKGWKLNQYGLYSMKTGKKVRGSGTIKSERDLAKFLGVSYRHPKVRE